MLPKKKLVNKNESNFPNLINEIDLIDDIMFKYLFIHVRKYVEPPHIMCASKLRRNSVLKIILIKLYGRSVLLL